MEMRTIKLTVKDPQRFEWGIREFYPEAKIRLIALLPENYAEYEIVYFKKEQRDGVAGYCKGYRNW